MFKRLVPCCAVLAVMVGGFVTITGGAVQAAMVKPTVLAGPGSSVQCAIAAKATPTPALKDDWVQAQHSTDPDAAVVALPNTTFSSPGAPQINITGRGTCTGNVSNGFNTAPVTSMKFTTSVDPAHPGSGPATCAGLFAGGSPAEYVSTIDWKATGAIVPPTVVTDSTMSLSGGEIHGSGGVLSGSFTEGVTSSLGILDSVTVGALDQSPPSSGSPVPAFRQCQPTLVLHTKSGVQSAQLRAPKGLKKFQLTTGSTFSATVALGRDPTAFVANSGDNTVTPIDLTTKVAGSPIAVGTKPEGIAITPNGATAYVVNAGDNTVTPIDTVTLTPGTAIPLGPNPGGNFSIAIAPDGTTAYVAESHGVIPIDLTTNTPLTLIPVDIPQGIAITPDGSTAFTTAGSCCNVVAINLASRTVVGSFKTDIGPARIAITPNGAAGYVTNTPGGTVTPFTPSTLVAGANIVVGTEPLGIAITPNGADAYVANFGSNSVTPINTATNTPGAPIAVASPFGVACTSDAAYVTNSASGTVTPIDIATNMTETPIVVGLDPVAIAIG
jgi:YVTN family beta-propeller protein